MIIATCHCPGDVPLAQGRLFRAHYTIARFNQQFSAEIKPDLDFLLVFRLKRKITEIFQELIKDFRNTLHLYETERAKCQ
jgi:hypothetical protein